MRETTPKVIAKTVIKLTGLDVFKETRDREYVETRALLNTMLRDDIGMGWTRIADFYKDNGKKMNHATVMHSVKSYPFYKQHNKKLQKLEGCFNFLSALASICLILSLVTENCKPTSSRV